MGMATFTNANSVANGGASFNVPQTINVNANAFIYNVASGPGENGLLVTNGSYVVNVAGVVGTTSTDLNSAGIWLHSLPPSPTPPELRTPHTLNIADTGYVFGGDRAIIALHRTNIVNKGTVEAPGIGIYQAGVGNWTLTNAADGVIASENLALFIENPGVHTIINNGQINCPAGFAILAALNGIEKVTNGGDIIGNVDLGDNNDVLTNNRLITGLVTMGTGNDLLINNRTLLTGAALGFGNDTFTNSGTATSDISGDDGNDMLTNNGTIDGMVLLGADNDTFKNFGKVTGAVLGEGGNDIIINSGTFEGQVSLGAGDDIFTGGGKSESVEDGTGKDTYNLGGGDDFFYAYVGVLTGDQVDKVNGGAGIDLYDASAMSADLFINLDTVNRTDPIIPVELLASTATDKGANEIGTDTVKNFENVSGGSGWDIIFGNAGANEINGRSGNDDLFGLGGRDRLFGGSGLDNLFGGAGRDVLNGGTGLGFDLAADTFIYLSVTDSLPGALNRDIIFNFEDDVDRIDLSAINESIGGTMYFILGQNQPFTETFTGEIRALRTGTGWVIQVDTGHDGKQDMAIEVNDPTHGITWSPSDFILA
jgi:hypothetical protein